MRVLLLHDQFWDERGGAAQGVATLGRGLARAGCRVTLLTTTAVARRCGTRQQDGMAIRTVGSRYPARWRPWVGVLNPWLLRAVRAAVAESAPDIVHVHNVHGHLSFAACAVAARCGAPVVLTAHDVQMFHPTKWAAPPADAAMARSLRAAVIRRLIRHSVRRILTVSRALQTAIEARGFGRVQTVYQGTEMDAALVDAGALAQFRRRHQLDGARVVFHGGRLGRLKGTGRLLEAFIAARSLHGRPVKLLLIGEANGYRARLASDCAAAGLAQDVVLLGWVDRPALQVAYAAADICVTPSLYLDPFPLMNIEAMAMGKPVVGTCFGGTPEIVEDGQTGYIVDPRDHGQLVGRIAELLNDPEKARAMGERGRERAATWFHADRYVQDVLRVYDEVRRDG